MQVKIKKLHPEAIIPTRGSAGAAGYDLYAYIRTDTERGQPQADSIEILPGEHASIHTGIAVEIPQGYTLELYPRSGLSVKNGLRLCNCVGLIDEDYRGELIVALYNDSSEAQTVSDGARIAQMVFRQYAAPELVESETLEETTRGTGGFGSTGA